jgi:hypothetical protein
MDRTPRRGPLPGFKKTVPMMPERVLKMHELRREGKTLRQIAAIFGVTPAGVAHNLHRWADWAEVNKCS